MSQPLPCGREVPRWSMLPLQPATVTGMASTAGLPAGSAIVWVDPPFDASASSCGCVLLSEPIAEKPHDEAEPMLYPASVTGVPPPQLLPPRPPATTLMLTESVSPRKFSRSAPNGEVLPDNVDCLTVAVPKLTIAPPPLMPAVLLKKVLSPTITVASLSIAPPPGPVFPVNVSPVTVSVPAPFTIAPPPNMVAVLLVNVLFLTVAVFWLKMPPPSCAVLPVNVLVVTVSVPLLSIPPPEVPVAAGEEFPVNVLPVTDRVPWLKIAPPPCTPLFARPLLSVSEVSVRWPAGPTSRMRKAGMPATADRLMVAPLPWIVTFPVMTGRPVPPSVAFLTVDRI